MKIVTSKELLDGKVIKVFSSIEAFAFRGTGLWTSICVGFANIFGVSSNCYANKMNKAVKSAKENLVAKAKSLGADAIVDYKIEHIGNAVCLYGTPVKLEHNEGSIKNNNVYSSKVTSGCDSINSAIITNNTNNDVKDNYDEGSIKNSNVSTIKIPSESKINDDKIDGYEKIELISYKSGTCEMCFTNSAGVSDCIVDDETGVRCDKLCKHCINKLVYEKQYVLDFQKIKDRQVVVLTKNKG